MAYISKILGKVGYTAGRLFRPRYRTVSEEFADGYDATVEVITGLRRLAAQTPETARPDPLDSMSRWYRTRDRALARVDDAQSTNPNATRGHLRYIFNLGLSGVIPRDNLLGKVADDVRELGGRTIARGNPLPAYYWHGISRNVDWFIPVKGQKKLIHGEYQWTPNIGTASVWVHPDSLKHDSVVRALDSIADMFGYKPDIPTSK